MKYLITIFTLLGCLVGSRSLAEIVPVWSAGVALPGERVILYLVDTGGNVDEPFSLAGRVSIPHADVRELPAHALPNRQDPTQGVIPVRSLMITPDQAGRLEVGELRVSYPDGREESVEVPALPVVSTSEITWYDAPFPYGALWYRDGEEGYVNEPVKCCLKLLLPGDIQSNNIAQMEAMGVSSSEFLYHELGTLNLLQQQFLPNPVAYARGETWRAVEFTGTVTPLREGNVGADASIEVARVMGLGFVTGRQRIPLPTLSLSALPLPPGAPADFDDAVGEYSVEATTDASSLAMHEVVEVSITVRGKGKLSLLECPRPVDADDWKLVPATRKLLTNISGEVEGVVFSQLMRPTAEVAGVPAFALSYFDPGAMEYRRAETRPIPLTWRVTEEAGSGLQTAAEPPPAGEVPIEEMHDIYGCLSGEQGCSTPLPRWLWYLLYLPALGILIALGVRSVRARLAAGASGRARERELARIAREDSGLAFLKSLGGFIEANVPTAAQEPELQQILARRDAEAFRPDAKVELSEEERSTMLRQVRRVLAKLATTAAALLLALCPTAWSAEEGASVQSCYEKGQFSQAREMLEASLKTQAAPEARPQQLYNLGNCHYRLNEPGKAALYYARALHINPGFREARANLAFVQRQAGSIVRQPRGVDSVFSFFTPQQLWVLTIICTAALALCLALQLAWRGRQRPWLHSATALTLLLSLACVANWVYYITRDTPDFQLLPPDNIAYVVAADTARSAADEQGAEVIRLTPASPVRLLAQRGSWSYVETAMGTRGWVHSASLAPLCEEGMSPRMPLSITF